jgi:hypothetical protein
MVSKAPTSSCSMNKVSNSLSVGLSEGGVMRVRIARLVCRHASLLLQLLPLSFYFPLQALFIHIFLSICNFYRLSHIGEKRLRTWIDPSERMMRWQHGVNSDRVLAGLPFGPLAKWIGLIHTACSGAVRCFTSVI